MKNSTAISISLATLGLALGYALGSLWIGAIIIAALGLGWLVGHQRTGNWLAALGLTACVGAAALGVWWGLSPGWMLSGTIAALAAWDLNQFARQRQLAGRIEGESQLNQAHLRRLVIVAGLGLLLGGIALSFQVELNLSAAILLGLLVVFGLSQIIGFIRRKSE